MSDNPHRPIYKLKSYPLEVAIWKFVDQETRYPRYSIKLTKRIKDKETGDYVFKPYFNPQETASASVLLAQAASYVASLSDEKL